MRLLLDTHALLWWLDGDMRLSARARRAIADADQTFASAASGWELAMKLRQHRLPRAEQMSNSLEGAASSQGFVLLPISFAHAERAGLLPGRHTDPFDRILAAQAILEGLTLVSTDAKMAPLGADVLW